MSAATLSPEPPATTVSEPPVRTYHFRPVTACNMCGADVSESRMLGMRLNRSQGKSPAKRPGVAVSVRRCGRCGLHFADPQPKPESLSDHYGVPADEYWPESYFEVKPEYFARQVADARRLLGLPETPGGGERPLALDIGAGIGKAMVALERGGFDPFGIEPSEPFREQAIERIGIDPDRLQLAAIEDADFPADHFDFVTFGAVLEHLYDPAGSIEQALRWTRPGGVIQIEVPSSDHLMAKLLNLFFRLRGTNFVTNLSPMHPPFHIYEFTPESFRRHAARAGCELAEHYFDVASIRHVPRFTHGLLRRWMDRRNSGQQLTVWLRKP